MVCDVEHAIRLHSTYLISSSKQLINNINVICSFYIFCKRLFVRMCFLYKFNLNEKQKRTAKKPSALEVPEE